jgi:hypothetical protein
MTEPVKPTSGPWLLGFVSLAAIPSLLLGDAAIAIARGWEAQSKFEWLIICSAALWLIATFTLVLSRRGRDSVGYYKFQFAICTTFVIVTWLASEQLLRVFWLPNETTSVHLLPPNTRRLFEPNPADMWGVDGESRYTINSLGVRGPELLPRDAAYRILCVGGSTTQCLYLDDNESWPHLLGGLLTQRARDMTFWVGNAGIAGYSTIPHLAFITKGDLWKEMDCVLFLVGANDLNRFLRFGSTLNQSSGEPSDEERAAANCQPIWRKSAVLEMVRLKQIEWQSPRMDAEDIRGANYSVRRKARQAAQLRDDMPDLTEALEQFGARIGRIIELCRAARVQPVFLTQPTLLSEDASAEMNSLYWSGDDGHGRYFRVADLRKGLDLYNE